MTAAGPLTHDEMVAWAADIAPRLAERAVEAEQRRALPAATVAECDAARVWELLVPTVAGGHGLGVRTLCETTRVLAHGCTSSAWTISFLALHNWFVLRAAPHTQDAVFGAHRSVRMACPLAPGGQAVPVDGGYRLSGRWQWATGVLHADWVSVIAFETGTETGAGAGTAGTPPVPRVLFLPIEDVEVVDVWHTSGMRATGSNDIVAEDRFVPAERTMTMVELRGDDPPGLARHDIALLRYPLSPVLALVASAPAVGAAEAAVTGFRDLVARRVLAYSLGDRQVDQPLSQARLAEALALSRAARAVWRDAVTELCDRYDAGESIPREERGSFRLAAAHAVRLARQAVDAVGVGSGASAYFIDAPLQRIERDLAMLKGHVVYDWDRVTQLVGRLDLGHAPAPTDML